MRTAISTALVLVALGAGAAPANAQNQGVTFTFGYFAPKGQDSRVAGDVLNADRCLDVSFQCEPLLFDVSDFGGLSFSGEYSIGIGKYFEAAFDVGFTQQTVPSVYALVTRPDGSEIQQDLKLRIVPITGLVRFIPTGRHARCPAVLRHRRRGAQLALRRERRVRRSERRLNLPGPVHRRRHRGRARRRRRPPRADGRRVHDRRGSAVAESRGRPEQRLPRQQARPGRVHLPGHVYCQILKCKVRSAKC